ncbi:MAG: hypothetical protein R3E68_12005 [Burkholderiaceae bacterium]
MNANTTKRWTLSSLALAVAGCANPAGTLMGVVHEGGSFRPVPHARVVFTPVADTGKPLSTELNYGGKFVLDLPAGEYRVSVEHPHLQVCASQPQPLVVLEGKSQRPQICVESAAGPTDPSPAPAPVPAPSAPPPAEPAPNVTLPPAQATALSDAADRVPSPTQSMAEPDPTTRPDLAPLPASPRLSDIPAQYPPAPPPAFAPASYRSRPIQD